jgi:glycosyltransferase involved in cell wall biosynthesis
LGIKKIYGLGHARNIGMLNAEGEYLLFVDDRLAIDENTIADFMKNPGEKNWQWGEKDQTAKGFVENFSFVSRRTLINIGGFSELITQYGGMTQEIRKRAETNGVTFSYNHEAKAKAISKSSSKWSKFLDIAKSKAQCYALGYE